MKSRLLISVLVIALAAAMIGGGTMAWFTAKADAPVNEFAAGTLLIGIEEAEFVGEEIDLSNLNPGDEWEGEIVVVNEGTKNLKFRGVMCYLDTLGKDLNDFGDLENYGTKGLSEALEMTLKVSGEQEDHNYLNNWDYDQRVIWSDTLSEYEDWAFDQHAPEYEVLSPLAPGEKIKYEVSFELPGATTGNEYQGSAISLKFGFLAGQWLEGEDKYPEFEPCSLPLDPPGFTGIPVRLFEGAACEAQYDALEAIDLNDPFTLWVKAPTLAGQNSTDYAVTSFYGDFGSAPSDRASGPSTPLSFDENGIASVTIGSPGVDADVNAWWDATKINNIEVPVGSERIAVTTE